MYAAPRGSSAFGRLASGWLGRDIDGGTEPADRPSVEGIDIDEVTEDARRYGFHATLKPPFRLADGIDPATVDDHVAALASRMDVVAIPSLIVDELAGFVAFRPEEVAPGLVELAAACVSELDDLRRPPDDLEVARRRKSGLSPTQDRYLAEWGYPYVFDEFRFHMTLSRRLGDEERRSVLAAARDWFAEVDGAPWVVDELCIVEELSPGEPFLVVARHPLGPGSHPPPGL